MDHHEQASTSMKLLLLLFAVVIVGALGYFVWQENTMPDTTDYSSKTVKKATTKTTTKTAIPALACGDTAKYGFVMTFGNLWTGMKIVQVLQKDQVPQPGYAVVTCYFTLPTTSTETVWQSAAIDHAVKYASVFAVSVFTPTQWADDQQEANKATELDHNASYYWGWSQAQAIPTDLTAAYADAKNVAATFQLVP